MTQATASPATAPAAKTDKTPLMLAVEANEWGQVTGLEAHATYFVIRKPTQELTRERSKEFVEDVRAFLHEQRVLAERQLKELQDRYEPAARSRIQEVRSTLEKRFDEITKEVETRIERIENELGERGILKGKKESTPAASPMSGATPTGVGNETPGEMPLRGMEPTDATTPPSAADKTQARKRGPRTSE